MLKEIFKIKKNIILSIILLYLLIVFIVSFYQKNQYVLLTIIITFFIIVFYMNFYLGLIFILLWFHHSIVSSQNKINNSSNMIEKFEINKEIDSDLNNVLLSFLDDDKYNYYSKTLSNYTLEEIYNISNINDINKLKEERLIKIFLNLYKIYFFDVKLCIELTKKNITNTNILKKQLNLLNKKQKLGLEFYLDPSKFIDEHYQILDKLFLFDDLFNNKKLNISQIQSIETYQEQNLKKLMIEKKDLFMTKELYEIIIIIIDNNLIYQELLEPINILYTIKNIKDTEINNNIFDKYNIKKRSNKYYEIFLKNNIINISNKNNLDNKDFGKFSIEGEITNTNDKELLEKEYKKIDLIKQEKNEKTEDLYLEKIVENFSHDINNIIDEIIEMYSSSETNNENKDFSQKFAYYSKLLIEIITKNGRMFNVGILLLLISLTVFFIETTK